MAIVQSLKRFRERFGLSQKDVAQSLGISQQAYSGYEFDFKGKPVTPSIDVTLKIAKAFNVSIDYLAGLTDDPRPVNQILAEMAAEQKETITGGNEISRLDAMQAQIDAIQARLDGLASAKEGLK